MAKPPEISYPYPSTWQGVMDNMRHLINPQQGRLFDPFEGLIPPLGMDRIRSGWQGIFRSTLLELMPAKRLGEHFDPIMGRPTKELYSVAGLLFLQEFKNWTVPQAVDAYLFHTDIQFALNLEPGVDEMCERTFERYRKLFIEDDAASQVLDQVTTRLIDLLEIDVRQQRLDSTHVFSNMASFGRTRLMAVTIKRFLTQVKRHHPADYAALPAELRQRYGVAQAQLLAKENKDAADRSKTRQQVAEDLRTLIDRFADHADVRDRPSYQALVKVFDEQCEIVDDKIQVRAKTGGDCLQNPSDPEATYGGPKGQGYKLQISETCSVANDVQLITEVLPQTAAEPDAGALVPMLEKLQEQERLPEEMLADTAYGGDDNVQAAADRGVEVVSPVAGRTAETETDPAKLTIDDFAHDERTGKVGACPTGRVPLQTVHDTAQRHDDGAHVGGRLRQLSAPPAVSRRAGPSGIQDQLHGQATASGRSALRRNDGSIPGAVRAAIGAGVDQQRLETAVGPGAAARAWPKGGTTRLVSEGDGLEPAAGGSSAGPPPGCAAFLAGNSRLDGWAGPNYSQTGPWKNSCNCPRSGDFLLRRRERQLLSVTSTIHKARKMGKLFLDSSLRITEAFVGVARKPTQPGSAPLAFRDPAHGFTGLFRLVGNNASGGSDGGVRAGPHPSAQPAPLSGGHLGGHAFLAHGPEAEPAARCAWSRSCCCCAGWPLILCVLLAMASITPWAENVWAFFWPDTAGIHKVRKARVHHVIVVDASLGMNQESEGSTCFDRATRTGHSQDQGDPGRRRLQSLGHEGHPRSGAAKPPRIPARMARGAERDHRDGRQRLGADGPDHASRKLADNQKRYPGQAVYFFTDMQKATWAIPLAESYGNREADQEGEGNVAGRNRQAGQDRVCRRGPG